MEEQTRETDPSLRASHHDGASHAVMMGCGETYLGPFGIFLRATTLQVGLLATLPPLMGALMQWAGALRMDRVRSRRRAIVTGALVQAMTFAPMALLPFVAGKGTFPVLGLLALMTLYHGANGVVVPIWNSLIGDLVPPNIRGRFFGQRNRLTGMSTFVSILLAGGILHLFQQWGLSAVGFAVVFLLAFAARLNSVRWLRRYDDPPFRMSPDQVFTFRQFLRRSPRSNFAQFVFFFGAINLGVAFAAPYFSLYMLRDLRFSYLEFTLVTGVATVTQFLTFRYWGELSDRFGTKKVLNLCGWAVGVVPVLWLFSHHTLYLVLIQVFAGLVWAGFSLASANFLFDAVTPPKRARCVAYQGLIHGAFVFAGSLAGGYAAGHLPGSYALGPWTWTPVSALPVIFLLSGIMRFAAAGLFLRKFREVRPVEPIRHRELIFRISHIKPIAGATFGLFTGQFREHRNGRDRTGRKNSGTSRVRPDAD